MKKLPEFKRREWTTKGADPTVVVEYSCKELGLTITEFQGIYNVELSDQADLQSPLIHSTQRLVQYITLVDQLGPALHAALEAARDIENEMQMNHIESGE